MSDKVYVIMLMKYVTGKAGVFCMKYVAGRASEWALKEVSKAMFDFCFPKNFTKSLRRRLMTATQPEANPT